VLALTTSPLPYGDGITDGPGFRMWNLLQEVVREHEVRVVSLYEGFHEGRRDLPPLSSGGLTIVRPAATPAAVRRIIREWSPDVLYLSWSAAGFLGRAAREIPTVLDYVGPGLLEQFVGLGRIPLPLLRMQLESFWLGDLFLTTTARERYYLIGLLVASGRLSTRDFQPSDPLILHLPMTPPSEPPPPRSPGDGAKAEPLLVLIAGAILPWYDYDTIARTAAALSSGPTPSVRFIVAGGNPRAPEYESKVRELLEAARTAGTVEFAGLIPFRDRSRLYNSADVALVVSPDSVEDELSARTRVVDYMWARLPVVTRGRDEYSEAMVAAGAAFEFGAGPGELTALLERLSRDRSLIEQARRRIDGLLEGTFNGAAVARPLMDFLDRPRRTRQRPGRMPKVEALALWASDMVRNAPGARRN
jgi:glycosyltransferase involved in cell wall biosynthesis